MMCVFVEGGAVGGGGGRGVNVCVASAVSVRSALL